MEILLPSGLYLAKTVHTLWIVILTVLGCWFLWSLEHKFGWIHAHLKLLLLIKKEKRNCCCWKSW